MPSPSIPRSKSVPKISGGTDPHSPAHSDDVLSRRTSWSENSLRTWSKKVTAFIARKAAVASSSPSSSSKTQGLTEESLKEFNRLNQILEEEKKDFQSSPYYNGLSRLTDSYLAINRQRPSSPLHDGDSHTGSLHSSVSSKMSFVYRMQEWGTSCFLAKDKDGKSVQDILAFPPSLSLPSSSRRKSTGATIPKENATKFGKELGADGKKVSSGTNMGDITTVTLNRKKPLRERVLQPPSPPHSTTQMPFSQRRGGPIQASTQAEPPQPSIIQASTQAQVQTEPPSQLVLPLTPTQASPTEMAESETGDSKPDQNERKYIWADKYRPYALKDFLCNRKKALELQANAMSENCCHFIFEGSPGVGKKTMIWALLREVFGEDNVQAREESKKFILKGEEIDSINVKIKQSSKHVEINISELRGYEKNVIVELIKEKSSKSTHNDDVKCNASSCRAVILYDADKLPTEALLYIKWVLERYKACNKVFFCCSDASKLMPLSSVCNLVQLLPPSYEEIIQVLEFIAEKEGIILPKDLAAKIATSSKNNLRQAIRSFEATWHFHSILKEDQEIMTGWEDDVARIARNVIEEQSPKQLYNIRGKLQNLIEHNVSAEYIFETIVKELKKNLDAQLQKQIDNLYEKYKVKAQKNDDLEKLYSPAHRQEGMGKADPFKKAVQQFMRIEEFIAKFMSWYKSFNDKNKDTRTHAS